MRALFLLGAVPLHREEIQSFPLADEYGFAAVKRLTGIPTLQQTANAARSSTMALRLVDELQDVDARIATIRAQSALKQAALLFYLPVGSPIGYFVVEKLEVTPLLIGRLGELRQADVALSLRETPADRIVPPIVTPEQAERRSGRRIQAAS